MSGENIFADNMATVNSATTSDISIDEMCRIIREFREKHPPESVLVKAVMPRVTWAELRKQAYYAPPPADWPLTIEGVPIEINDNIPAACYSLEYADGHADMITPTGKFRWKEPQA